MNQLTTAFRTRLLTAQVDWPNLTLKLAIMDGSYTFDPDTPAAIPQADAVFLGDLTGLAVSGGWAQADPVWVSGADTERTMNQIVIGEWDAVNSEVDPIAHISMVPGLPTTFSTPFWLAWQAQGVFRP